MHENNERKHRINDYRLNQLMEKQRNHAENLAAIKSEKEYLKIAKRYE